MKGYYNLSKPTFEEYQQRGVFIAQQRTAEVAKVLAVTFNNTLRTEDLMKGCRRAPHNLRVSINHRDNHSQRFRNAVASEMRFIRAEQQKRTNQCPHF